MSYDIADLRTLMARLRDPQSGCPWDLQQDFCSIAPHTLEEVYEVVDTIERADYLHLREELGDLLFQVIFYSQLGAEQQLFNFDQVVNDIVEKLLLRHPHVFPDGTLQGEVADNRDADQSQIKTTWENIKQDERSSKGRSGVLDDVPLALPALSRAQKLQKRAARVGFDWPDSAGVLCKLEEELAEMQQAVALDEPQQLVEELGDLMFTCVNFARHLGVDAEQVVRAANRKFEHRFETMEGLATQALSTLSEQQLEQLWDDAKAALSADTGK